MKHRLAAALAVALAVAAASPSAARPVKLGTLAPQGSPWYNAIRDMAEEWKAATGGKVTVRIYPGGAIGDEPDMVRKMRIGQLDAAALSGVGLSRIAQEIQALQMPMMFRSAAELAYVRARIGPKLERVLVKKGYKVLNWGDAGWVYFFTQKPVVHPDDLKPLKLFAWVGETAHIAAWRDAGYQPVPLPATEIHTALQSGLINAVPTTPVAALSYQWFGLAKHMTDLKWAPLVGATVIALRAWRKIPAEMRPKLLKSAHETGARLQQAIATLDSRAVEVMKKHGLTVHPVSADVAAEWEKRARAGYPRIVGKIVPAATVAEVERLRDAYRAAKKGR